MPNITTEHLQLPLPHQDNLLEQDVLRISTAFTRLDVYAATTDATLQTTGQAIEALAADTVALATLAENLEKGKVDTQDSRLGDARTPKVHAASHKTGGNDALNAADIGGVTPDQLPTADGDSLIADKGIWSVNSAYLQNFAATMRKIVTPYFDPDTGKFHFPGYAGQFEGFQLPTPPENWMVCTGGWLENADTDYPELWRNLQHPAFATLVLTDAQWTAKSTAAGGVGGVPFFVVDAAAKRIRLPDTRGDYTRAAGSSYLQAVGEWHDSAIVNITGEVTALMYRENNMGAVSGVFSRPSSNWGGVSTNAYGTLSGLTLNASSMVKTAADNRTRTYATLGCVCVGPTQTQPSVP